MNAYFAHIINSKSNDLLTSVQHRDFINLLCSVKKMTKLPWWSLRILTISFFKPLPSLPLCITQINWVLNIILHIQFCYIFHSLCNVIYGLPQETILAEAIWDARTTHCPFDQISLNAQEFLLCFSKLMVYNFKWEIQAEYSKNKNAQILFHYINYQWLNKSFSSAWIGSGQTLTILYTYDTFLTLSLICIKGNNVGILCFFFNLNNYFNPYASLSCQ